MGSGADLFVVPSSQVEEARSVLGEMVADVAVDTLDDALQALRSRGGNLSGISSKTQ